MKFLKRAIKQRQKTPLEEAISDYMLNKLPKPPEVHCSKCNAIMPTPRIKVETYPMHPHFRENGNLYVKFVVEYKCPCHKHWFGNPDAYYFFWTMSPKEGWQ